MGELWLNVPNYEDRYQVSNLGNVRSKGVWTPTKGGAKQYRAGRVLKPMVNRYGYLYVCLSDGKHKKNKSIHRLVMAAFVGESELTVNHKDEDKANNALDNLEYLTAEENLQYGTGKARREAGVLVRRVPVESFDLKTGETIQRFDGVNETAKYGFSPQNVSHCCNGKLKSHHGYGWRRSK